MNRPPAIMGVLMTCHEAVLLTCWTRAPHLCGVDPPLLPLLVRQVLPLEHQVPVEASPQVGAGPDVLEVVHADHVYDGAHHSAPVLDHPGHQGLQPVLQDVTKSLIHHSPCCIRSGSRGR